MKGTIAFVVSYVVCCVLAFGGLMADTCVRQRQAILLYPVSYATYKDHRGDVYLASEQRRGRSAAVAFSILGPISVGVAALATAGFSDGLQFSDCDCKAEMAEAQRMTEAKYPHIKAEKD